MKEKLSVVIPFFRDERTFASALESVDRQGDDNFEIVVVVDGDNDEARAFFSPVDHPQLTVYYLPENRGSGAARNLGVARATGSLIAFLDADDEWCGGKLAAQRRCLDADPTLAGCHTAVETFDGEGKRIAVYADKPARLEFFHLLEGNQVLTSSFVLRRDAFEAVGGFDESLRTSQDFDLVLRLVQAGAQLALVPEVLTRLRRAGHGNISSRGALLLRNHLRIAWRHRRALVAAGGWRGWLRFVAKYLVEDGSRMPGVRGRLAYRAGVFLRWITPATRRGS